MHTGNSMIPTDAEHDAHYCVQSCITCGQVMTFDDREAEHEAQDDLCQDCRDYLAKCKAEAIAEIESPDFPSPSVQAAAAMLWPRSNFATLTEWLDYVKIWWPKLASINAIFDTSK